MPERKRLTHRIRISSSVCGKSVKAIPPHGRMVDCLPPGEPWISARQQAVEIIYMKFRVVWLGPVDEPDRCASVPGEIVSVSEHSRPVRYEQHGTGMVRCEQLRNHSEKVTPLANFSARIVRDIAVDDDVEQQRNFGIEAE